MPHISAAVMLLLSLITPVFSQGSPAKHGDIAGAWILIEQFKDETHAHRMSLEVAGNKITGRSGSSKIEGDITESVITLKWLTPDGGRVDATYTGKSQGGLLKGEGIWGDAKLQWSAHRPPVRPGGAPRTHTFAIKYDVADLVGTQVGIVAKIPRTVIAQLKRQ